MKVMLSVVGCVAALSSNPFTGERLQAMERDLATSCGQPCVEAFHDTLHELNSQKLGDSQAWLHGITKLMENVEQQAHARSAQIATRTSMLQTSKSQSTLATTGSGSAVCNSEASCALVQAFANKCNYARVSLQQSYEAVNVATHVLGVMVSAACGCTYSGTQAACLLQGVPPTCVFPYMVYSRVFSASNELWEALKGSTKSCTMHGDPRISS